MERKVSERLYIGRFGGHDWRVRELENVFIPLAIDLSVRRGRQSGGEVADSRERRQGRGFASAKNGLVHHFSMYTFMLLNHESVLRIKTFPF